MRKCFYRLAKAVARHVLWSWQDFNCFAVDWHATLFKWRTRTYFESYFKDCFLIHFIEQLRWLEAILDDSLEMAPSRINKSEIEEVLISHMVITITFTLKYSWGVRKETSILLRELDKILIGRMPEMLGKFLIVLLREMNNSKAVFSFGVQSSECVYLHMYIRVWANKMNKEFLWVALSFWTP